MSARLTSAFYVAAYIRRCEIEGAFAVLRRRGAQEAGAIFVKVDSLDGRAALYGPAPQSLVDDDGERRFVRLTDEGATPLDAEDKLQRQLRYDDDLWVVEVEDRQGRAFLPLASEA